MVNSLITTNGKKTKLYRAYTDNADLSATQYLIESQFQVGINQGDVGAGTTQLDYPIPISNGTVNDDGSNTLTGSSGGDNSTDNTTTYKQGAGLSDNTAQNLIANDTNATKIWTISNLATAGTVITGTKPFAMWLYIKDQDALNKIVSVEVKLGSDTSNYYSLTTLNANLSTGWNWITSNRDNVEDLTETGTVSGTIDTFIIEIVTNNATDEFVAGDVVYDLLRQWEESDLFKDIQTGYPTILATGLQARIKTNLNSLEANGFLINAIALYNKDTTPLLLSIDKFDADSKSQYDEFNFYVDDLIL